VSRRTRIRLLCSILAPILLLVAGEYLLRLRVPACGVTPFRLSEVPGLSSELRPGFTTLYKGFQVSLNSHGFRGGEFPPRQEGVLRVALVGDSFTFGSAVAVPNTLAARLEAALIEGGTPAQVLNLGVPGYTAGNVAAVVEHKALALEPDVVVYVFYANDVLPLPAWEEISPDAVIDGMHGFTGHSALLQWTNVRFRQYALRWFDKQLTRQTPEMSRDEWEEGGGERVRAAIVRMRDVCAARGARLLVAGYPNLTFPEHNPFRPIDEAAAGVCDELGVAFVDLLEAFGQERDLTRYWASVFDTHPNGAANACVGAFLVPHLTD